LGDDNKKYLKEASFKLDIELTDLDPIIALKEKALSNEHDKHQKRAEDMYSERLRVEGLSKCNVFFTSLVADTDKAIMTHPKSRKREILNLRKQLEELKDKL